MRNLAGARWGSAGHGSCRCQKARSSQILTVIIIFTPEVDLEPIRPRHFPSPRHQRLPAEEFRLSECSGNTEALAAVSVMGLVPVAKRGAEMVGAISPGAAFDDAQLPQSPVVLVLPSRALRLFWSFQQSSVQSQTLPWTLAVRKGLHGNCPLVRSSAATFPWCPVRRCGCHCNWPGRPEELISPTRPARAVRLASRTLAPPPNRRR